MAQPVAPEPVAAAEPDPIVIYRSVNRDGETYALEPHSLDRLREAFGQAVHFRDRLFITHERGPDYEHVHAAVAPQVVMLLTGMPEQRLEPVGGVIFRDAKTERDLPRAQP